MLRSMYINTDDLPQAGEFTGSVTVPCDQAKLDKVLTIVRQHEHLNPEVVVWPDEGRSGRFLATVSLLRRQHFVEGLGLFADLSKLI